MALCIWLPLNGNLENKGLSNGTIALSGATVDNNGKLGKTYLFDANDDYISIDSADLRDCFKGGENPFTVAMWVYNTKTTGSRAILFGDYGLTGTIQFNIELNAGSSYNDDIRFYWAGSPDYRATGTNAAPNTWVHLAVTYDGTKLDFYRNGILINTRTGVLASKDKTSGVFYLGRDSRTGGTAFGGRLNDIRIYDECLSQKQIKEISKGLIAHYKLTGVGANKNYIKNSDWSNKTNGGIYTFNEDEVTFHSDVFEASGHSFAQTMDSAGVTDFRNKVLTFSMEYQITEPLVFGTKNPWVGFELNISRNTTTGGSNQWLDWYGGKSIPTAVTDGWVYHKCSVTVTDYDIASIGINFYMRDTTGTIKYRHPKVEIGNVATPWIPNEADVLYSKWKYGNNICTDLSGYKYNLTQVGTPIFNSDSPRYSGSTYFDGVSYLTSATGSMSWFDFNNFTISAWFKPTVKPSSWTGSIGIQQDGGSNGKIFSISNYAGNFSVHTDNGSTWVTTQSNELPLNEWSFCVATLTNGTDLKMYINGVQVKTATIDYNTATVKDDTRIVIGVDLPGDDEKYTGCYSDVRVYTTVLSVDDILTMYKNSGIIDNKGNVYAYEFKEE